jgi:hypothetical protein
MTMMDPVPSDQPTAEDLRGLIGTNLMTDAALQLVSLSVVTGLKVERMHFPNAKPVQLQIRAMGENGSSEVLIGEWMGTRAGDVALTEVARLAKPRRGQAALDGVAIVADAKHGLVLRRPGFDAKLPGLRLLHDAGFAHGRLADLGCDPEASVALVSHRLTKRAVLRISGRDGVRYARLRPVTSGSGRAAYDQHQALGLALQGAASLAIPRALGFDPELGLALFEALPGTPPQFQGLDGFRATKAVMTAVGALQKLEIDAPMHGVQDEWAILQSWATRTAEVFPDLGDQLAVPLARLREDMFALPQRDLVACHRDLHEGQILLHQGRAGLLDFDTLRLGDPALDVGNLQAHLVLASLRDGRPRQAFYSGIEACLPYLPLTRIAVWRRAALLRLAMIYAFTAEPRAIIHSLICEAHDV